MFLLAKLLFGKKRKSADKREYYPKEISERFIFYKSVNGEC
jgi:hypothetical protein